MEEILLNSLKVKKLFFSERVESREFFFIKIKGNGICEKLQKNMKAHYFSCQNSFTLQNSIMRFVKKSKVNNRSLYDPDFAIQKCIFCRVNFFGQRKRFVDGIRQKPLVKRNEIITVPIIWAIKCFHSNLCRLLNKIRL